MRSMGRKGMGAKKGTITRLIREYFGQYKLIITLSLIFLIFSSAANLSSSIFIILITNAITKSLENPLVDVGTIFSAITPYLIAMAGIYFVAIFTTYFSNRNMAVCAQKYMNSTRKKMFDHMETLPIKYFDTHAHGDIMSMYTNDIDTIRQLASSTLPSLFQQCFTITICILAMVYFSIWLTLVVLVGCVAMFITTKVVGGRSSKYFVKAQKAIGVVEGDIEEAMNGLKVIKVFSHEEKSFETFKKKNDQLCFDATQANIASNVLGPIMGNIGNFLYIIIAIVGIILIVTKAPNIGLVNVIPFGQEYDSMLAIVLGFLQMSRMFANNVNNLAQQLTFVFMGTAGASRVYDLIDEPSEKDEGFVTLVNIEYKADGTFVETKKKTRDYAWKYPHEDGSITYTELKGDILLDTVDFAYNPIPLKLTDVSSKKLEDGLLEVTGLDENKKERKFKVSENEYPDLTSYPCDPEKLILRNVSVFAKPGQKVAFVGATGAGKTTITNLINRFYDIADGKIRYDGININKIKKDDLRRSLGIVLQDTNLFTGTVLDNIRYGRLDATDKECKEAAKIANAYGFIERLPQGFNTMLTADGANLSQGQRQLISIARAAVADLPVMILDEATSSIDTRTEKLVQKGTDQLMEGRTVFVIAHRLSTVQNSDCIMVLEHGQIIERGSHKELIAKKGTYYQLYTGAFELE